MSLLFIEAQAARLIVSERLRMIERAGVQPHALGAGREAAFDGARQEMAPQAGADERRQEAEVGDLHAAAVLAFQLEVTRWCAVDGQHPRFEFGAFELVE